MLGRCVRDSCNDTLIVVLIPGLTILIASITKLFASRAS